MNVAMKRIPPVLACTLLSATILHAACGSSADAPSAASTTSTDGSTSAVTSPPDAVAASVGIDGFAYTPDTVTVAVGTIVTWTNDEDVTHTVTADDGSFDSGELAIGDTFEHPVDASGTFTYACSIHPSMAGTITVE